MAGPDLDQLLTTLARRRAASRLARTLGPALTAGLAIATTLVLLLRLSLPQAAFAAPVLALCGLLLPLLARLPRALAQREPRWALAGRLDELCGARGLAMALAAQAPEARDPAWRERLAPALSALRLPRPDLRALLPPALAGLALTIALALPQRPPELPALPPPVARFFEPAAAALARAEQAALLPPAQIEALRERLERLQARAEERGMDQARWAALDRLGADLDAALEHGARRLSEALRRAEAAASPTREAALQAQDAGALAEALAALASSAPGLAPPLELRAAAAAAAAPAANPGAEAPPAFDAEAARALAERIAEQLEGRCEQLAASTGLSCTNPAEGEGPSQGAGAEGEGDARGGPSRGGGPAPLTWETPVEIPGGAALDLPEGTTFNADGSVTLGLRARAPELDAAALDAARRAADRAFGAVAADARRAAVAPRHRAVVGRYFAAEPHAPHPGDRPR